MGLISSSQKTKKTKKHRKIFLLFYVFSFKVKFGNTYRVGQKYPIYLNIVLLLTLCKNYPKRVEYDGGLFGKGFFFISVRVYLDLLRTYLAWRSTWTKVLDGTKSSSVSRAQALNSNGFSMCGCIFLTNFAISVYKNINPICNKIWNLHYVTGEGKIAPNDFWL